MPPRSVAVAQTVPVRGDVEANTAQHLELARAAAEAGARLVVFPELSLTGYELDLADALAFDEHDARLRPLADAAATLGLTMVAGAPVRLGDASHIGAFIVEPGRIDLYTKHHLGAFTPADNPGRPIPPAEPSVFTPGARNPLVGDAAIAVCADLGHPEHAATAGARGARTYLASMFVIPAEIERDHGRARTYAREHGMVVALANYGGATGGLPAAGRSAIWSPTGEPIVELPSSGAGVAVAVETAEGWRTYSDGSSGRSSTGK